MIDAHCHLEQPDYDKDRDEVVKHLKKDLKAIITVCTNPKDLDKTFELVDKYKGFVFATAAIHPEYIREMNEKIIEHFLEKLKENKDKIVGIGETGIDFYWVREKGDQKRQIEMFKQFINFAKEIRKPLVVHSREAYEEVLSVLENEDAKHVLLHMWGEKSFIERIKENGFHITIGPIIERSKNHKKIAKDFPIEKILLETDSPWFGGKTEKGDRIRGTPLNIKIPAGKIAEIKKIEFNEVWRICGENAIKFFNLSL